MPSRPTTATGAGRYEIRIQGHLESRWAARLAGLTLTNCHDGTTIIDGPVVDQTALHGLLRTVRDLGLPLISVTRLEPDQLDLSTGQAAEPSIQPRRTT